MTFEKFGSSISVMFTKAVFIDFKEEDVPTNYFKKIKSLFKSSKLILRDDKNLNNELKETEAIFCKISTKIDKDIIDAAPKLKYIGVLSTAFDAIDAKYARTKGITVCNLGGYSTEAVSEFAIATLFEYVRDLERAKNQARRYDFSFANFMQRDLRGRTLGVVGAGKIGSRIAEIALGIGMKVIYYSRKKKPLIEKLGAKKKTLDAVISGSEFLMIALVLNKETEGIINDRRIASIKKGACVINIAPPKLLDNEAMLKRTTKGDITFIFDHSDDIDLSLAKKFMKSKGAIVYPPVAFRTEEANTNRFETFTSNILGFSKNKPQNVVN